jgi:hypothetical protein
VDKALEHCDVRGVICVQGKALRIGLEQTLIVGMALLEYRGVQL